MTAALVCALCAWSASGVAAAGRGKDSQAEAPADLRRRVVRDLVSQTHSLLRRALKTWDSPEISYRVDVVGLDEGGSATGLAARSESPCLNRLATETYQGLLSTPLAAYVGPYPVSLVGGRESQAGSIRIATRTPVAEHDEATTEVGLVVALLRENRGALRGTLVLEPPRDGRDLELPYGDLGAVRMDPELRLSALCTPDEAQNYTEFRLTHCGPDPKMAWGHALTLGYDMVGRAVLPVEVKKTTTVVDGRPEHTLVLEIDGVIRNNTGACAGPREVEAAEKPRRGRDPGHCFEMHCRWRPSGVFRF